VVHPGAFGSPEPDVPLDTSWPGLDPQGRQVRADPDAMEHLAEMLLTECDSIRNEYLDGSLKHFGQTAGKQMVTKDGLNPFGEWSSAHGLRELHAEVYDYTNTIYGQLVQQLEAAAQGLKAAADRYRNAEDSTLSAMPTDTSTMAGTHGHTSAGASYSSAGTTSSGREGAHQPVQATDFEGPDQ
jgi:hypothetical protein